MARQGSAHTVQQITAVETATPEQQLAAAVIAQAIADAAGPDPARAREAWAWLRSDRCLPWLGLIVPESVDPEAVRARALAAIPEPPATGMGRAYQVELALDSAA